MLPYRLRTAWRLFVVAFAASGCGPWGPLGIFPGGPLVGSAPEQSAAEACGEDTLLAALETRSGWLRHSVTVFCFARDGELYIGARNGGTKRWTRNALADRRARIEIGGAVHRGRLVRVADVEPGAAHVFLRKVAGVEVDEAHFLLDPPEPGDDRTDLWLFRFEEDRG
ncbi:MAG TPA: hypothetical protein VML54_15190 [Candidatus Limnocylindrales bacterium]|nr:hypothetical protein [Candidatus Limnocylindrales bacterium]